jgi:hypothetical protein
VDAVATAVVLEAGDLPLIPALLDWHVGWSWFVVIGNGLAGAWALAANWWEGLRSRALWWFTAGVELAVVVQLLIGVSLITAEDLEAPEFHIFYGVVAVVAVAVLWSYRSQLRHRLYLLYGLGGLFVMGLGIRAMVLT